MVSSLLAQLESRRRELRMPMKVLARKSKVSLRTAYRVLGENDGSASLEIVAALAAALKVRLDCRQEISSEAFVRKQAKLKAHKMAGMTQGSAALEGQAVSRAEQQKLERALTLQLITGSASKLWG